MVKCVWWTEFMHGIGADRYVYFYLAVEVWLLISTQITCYISRES